jgi:hypothetical protein
MRQCVKQRHLQDVYRMSNQWPAHTLEPLASVDLAIWLGVRGWLEVHFAVMLLIGRQLLGSLLKRITLMSNSHPTDISTGNTHISMYLADI